MTFSFKRFWWLSSIFIVLGVATVDGFALANHGPEATFSHFVLNASEAHPVIPLVVGVVLGHLFWPQKKT